MNIETPLGHSKSSYILPIFEGKKHVIVETKSDQSRRDATLFF